MTTTRIRGWCKSLFMRHTVLFPKLCLRQFQELYFLKKYLKNKTKPKVVHCAGKIYSSICLSFKSSYHSLE